MATIKGSLRSDVCRRIAEWSFSSLLHGAALDEVQGLDLRRTTPPVIEVIDEFARQFPTHKTLFAVQAYEQVSVPSLNQIRMRLDWTDLRIYPINDKGRNYGVILGTKGWVPR